MFDVALAVVLLGLPGLAIGLCKHFRALDVLGPVVLCYGLGMLLGVGLNSLPMLMEWQVFPGSKVPEWLMQASIPLAIPLLLFGLNLKAWVRQSKTLLLSFTLAMFSVVLMACLGYVVFADATNHAAAVSGMLTGMYIGGTPSMAVVHLSVDAPSPLLLSIQSADFIVGGLYLLFLLSLARLVFGWLLPNSGLSSAPKGIDKQLPEQQSALGGIVRGFGWVKVLLALGLSVCIALASVAVSWLVYDQCAAWLGVAELPFLEVAVPLIMLLITLLAVCASLVPAVRGLPSTYAAGYYLMLVFCVALGSLVDITAILDNLNTYLGYVCFVMLGSIALHLLLAWICRIDRDTFIITSTAAIYGPPFIPSVANALRNPAMVFPGLTTSLVGYVFAHVLGVTVVKVLMSM